jgi:hypothetical protein
MLELLAETLVYQRKQRLDSIRDQVRQLLKICKHHGRQKAVTKFYPQFRFFSEIR